MSKQAEGQAVCIARVLCQKSDKSLCAHLPVCVIICEIEEGKYDSINHSYGWVLKSADVLMKMHAFDVLSSYEC